MTHRSIYLALTRAILIFIRVASVIVFNHIIPSTIDNCKVNRFAIHWMNNVDLNVPRFIFIDRKSSTRLFFDESAFFTRTYDTADTRAHAKATAD